MHDRTRPHTHSRFDVHQRPDGAISVDIRARDVDGMPYPAFTVDRPSEGWSIAACLDAATAYASETTGAKHTKEHRIIARYAYLAMLDGADLRYFEILQRLNGIDVWADRYPSATRRTEQE